MKLKKLFAGVVAVAMMATMAFPAFAARPTPNVGSDGLVTITKKYTVTGSEEKKALLKRSHLRLLRVQR